MGEGGGIGVTVEDLTVRYAPGRPATDQVSFRVAPGEFFVLVGPSGCGKSTVLRAIAGLVRPERGRVSLGGRTVTDVAEGILAPPSARHLGLVFQSYALWPHMTVAENVRFPLEARDIPKGRWGDLVSDALARVSLSGFSERTVPSLSGGQQQRTALARALVSNPPAILLDEPLSNLDGELRRQMRLELKAIQRELGATIVHVTHDREEAMELADRLAVMKDGRLLEVGGPEALYRRPRQAWTAGFLGECTILPGTPVEGDREGRLVLRTAVGRLATASGSVAPDPSMAVMIRAEDVQWRPPGGPSVGPATNEENDVAGRIDQIRYLGSRTLYGVATGGIMLWASSTVARGAVGDDVTVHLPPEACVIVESQGP